MTLRLLEVLCGTESIVVVFESDDGAMMSFPAALRMARRRLVHEDTVKRRPLTFGFRRRVEDAFCLAIGYLRHDSRADVHMSLTLP